MSLYVNKEMQKQTFEETINVVTVFQIIITAQESVHNNGHSLIVKTLRYSSSEYITIQFLEMSV